MCEVKPAQCALSAIFAAVFAVLFFNAVWLQQSMAGAWGSASDTSVLFLQYLVAFLFLGSACMMCMKGKKEAKRR